MAARLQLLWPDLLMVRHKSRHPHSQGSLERLNCDVKAMLIAWLGDTNSTDWPMGLRFVQFQTPNKALFGTEARIGLRTSVLPTDILERMVSGEDLIPA